MIGVTATPFKCPPAPSETALLVHDFLVDRGLRDRSEISLVMPLPTPIPPSQQASEALLVAFAERGIHWRPGTQVVSLDPSKHVGTTADGDEIGYDLFLGVPVHVAPDVALRSGMCENGWIPVNARTLETRYPGVYAIGDVTSVGTPKAGVFAEGQARVVASAIAASMSDQRSPREYDGRGQCYLEFGQRSGCEGRRDLHPRSRPPFGTFEGASKDLAEQKGQIRLVESAALVRPRLVDVLTLRRHLVTPCAGLAPRSQTVNPV